VRILVVGNPCNTNCLIARSNAQDVPDDRWFAMTRLDQNRAETQLAKKAACRSRTSKTWPFGQSLGDAVPRLWQRHDQREKATDVITDLGWLQGDFITTVQKRGAAVIEARGLSSAASAANAAIDTVASLVTATTSDDCVSVAVTSHGEYGVPEGLTFGFPIVSNGNGSWKVKESFESDEFAKVESRSRPTNCSRARRGQDLGLI